MTIGAARELVDGEVVLVGVGPPNAAANLERLRANVVSQADSLKPDVPENTVIDTKSREMWLTDLRDPERRLSDIASVEREKLKWSFVGWQVQGPTPLPPRAPISTSPLSSAPPK